MKNSSTRIQVALFTALVTLATVAIVGCGNSSTPNDTVVADTSEDIAEVQVDVPGTDTDSDSIDVPGEIPGADTNAGEVIQTGSCRLELVPHALNFGAEPVGTKIDKEIRFVNTGTGTCTVTAFKIAECPVVSGDFVCPDPLEGNDSALFTLKSPATVVGLEIGPGSTSSLTIEFSGINQTVGDIHAAMISAEVQDDAGFMVIPECGTVADTECAPTMDITVYVGPFPSPDLLNCGSRIAGCEQSKRQACVFNNGPEVDLESLTHEDCGTEFVFENVPGTFPATLQANKLFCIDITYSPADEGFDRCSIVWTIDGKTIETAVSATGSDDSSIMENFFAAEGQVEFETLGIPRAIIGAEINYVACNEGWTIGGTVDKPTIVFGEPCIPAVGDFVEIHYDVACPQ